MVHYEVNWPIKIIEEYLIQSNYFIPTDCFFSKVNEMSGLVLADKYDLTKLRTNIFKNIDKANKVVISANQSEIGALSKRTKYLLMRRCIQEEPKILEDGELSNEIKTIVKIMDKFFLD